MGMAVTLLNGPRLFVQSFDHPFPPLTPPPPTPTTPYHKAPHMKFEEIWSRGTEEKSFKGVDGRRLITMAHPEPSAQEKVSSGYI